MHSTAVLQPLPQCATNYFNFSGLVSGVVAKLVERSLRTPDVSCLIPIRVIILEQYSLVTQQRLKSFKEVLDWSLSREVMV